MATFIGGNLLMLKTPFVGHEPRNFTALFLICCACSILMLLNAWLLVDEPKDKRLFKEFFPAPEENSGDDKVVVEGDGPKKVVTMVSKEEEKKSPKNVEKKEERPLRILFDLNNMKDMFRTFVKPRPYHVRLHLILIIFASMTVLLAYIGPAMFLYQYVQKVFSWNSSQYSNYSTITSAINIASMFILAPLCLKVKALQINCLFNQLILLTSLGIQTVRPDRGTDQPSYDADAECDSHAE